MMNSVKQEQLSNDLFERAEMNLHQSEQITRPSLSYWQDVWLRVKKNPAAITGAIMLLIIIFFAIFGPSMNEYGYDDQDLSRAKLPPKVPVLEHISWLNLDGKDSFGNDVYAQKGIDDYFWFGTDALGRDLWTRVWEGTRISLYIGILAALIDMVIGVAYGGVSAYYGGRVDNVMQRIVEILYGIPFIIVVMLMILVFEPGILSIVIAMTITGWIGMSRVVRGQILKLKNQEYVLAARTLGASNTRIIVQHLVPNMIGIIIINTMFTIPSAIFTEAFLSFIGLGLQPPLASLGTLIDDGFKSLQTFPHIMVFPAIIISILLIAFNLVADGLRDALDPKMRK